MKNIIWHDFINEEPPLVNNYYVIETTGGNVYFDKWIYEPFESWVGHFIENTWENTQRGFVESWAFVEEFTLADYIKLYKSESS